MNTETRFRVNWDNGNHACGTFPNVFHTHEAAEEFGNNWVADMMASDAVPEGEDGYSFEVIEEEVQAPAHTPAPCGWEWQDHMSDLEGGHCLIGIADAEAGINETWILDAIFPEGDLRADANRALIAAAPELLAALREAAMAHGPKGDDSRPAWWFKACAVLAKVEPVDALDALAEPPRGTEVWQNEGKGGWFWWTTGKGRKLPLMTEPAGPFPTRGDAVDDANNAWGEEG